MSPLRFDRKAALPRAAPPHNARMPLVTRPIPALFPRHSVPGIAGTPLPFFEAAEP